MQDVSEFLKASRKCRKSRENWYADELLEDITRIQEHANNKDITKDEYFSMLDGIARKIRKIKNKDTNKTYFGINIFEDDLVKEDDIKKLPFYDFFKESMKGSTYLEKDGINYIYLKDWENFCNLFIETGNHRFSK